MTWSFHENKRSVLIMGDQGEPIARVQCVEGNHEDDVRRAKEICQANKTIGELKARIAQLEAQLSVACKVQAGDRVGFDFDILEKIANLEMENARLNIHIAGLALTAGCVEIQKAKNEILNARIAKLEDVLKRANDIAELWVCEGSWGEDERELLDIIAFNQWREE